MNIPYRWVRIKWLLIRREGGRGYAATFTCWFISGLGGWWLDTACWVMMWWFCVRTSCRIRLECVSRCLGFLVSSMRWDRTSRWWCAAEAPCAGRGARGATCSARQRLLQLCSNPLPATASYCYSHTIRGLSPGCYPVHFMLTYVGYFFRFLYL